MKKLEALFDKTFFTTLDIVNLLNYTPESAHVFCSRYTKNGIFIKLRNDLYTLSLKWKSFTTEDFFKISAFLRVPSYISLNTALSYYGITTQIQQSYFENITIKSTKQYEVNGAIFKYCKVNERLFNNYAKMDGFFIASKEKAFMDMIYLYSFGKYSFDKDAIDFSKLDKKTIFSLAEQLPSKTVKSLKKLWKD